MERLPSRRATGGRAPADVAGYPHRAGNYLADGQRLGAPSKLHGKQLAVITSLAAALGLLMILLKDVVFIHLH